MMFDIQHSGGSLRDSVERITFPCTKAQSLSAISTFGSMSVAAMHAPFSGPFPVLIPTPDRLHFRAGIGLENGI